METLELKKWVLNSLLELINNTKGDTITLSKTLLWNITMGELKDIKEFEELLLLYEQMNTEISSNKEMLN